MAELTYAKYGKDKVRVFRIVRNADGTQDVAEYVVCALLEGDIETAWTKSDNTCIVTTDSIKNTTYLFAKKSPNVLQPESFAIELGIHFVKTYPHIHKAHIDVVKLKWSRISVEGKPHKHSFVRDGAETRFTNVTISLPKGTNTITGTCKSGISGLLVLKSSGSSFENYIVDEFTTLQPVEDRIFSTSVDLSYTIPIPSSHLASVPSSLTAPSSTALKSLNALIPFEKIFSSVETATLEVFATHDSASVQATLFKMCERILKENKEVGEVSYKLPNKHYFAIDMSYIGIQNTKPKDAEVFVAVDAPSGLIIATVGRKAGAKL